MDPGGVPQSLPETVWGCRVNPNAYIVYRLSDRSVVAACRAETYAETIRDDWNEWMDCAAYAVCNGYVDWEAYATQLPGSETQIPPEGSL